MSKLVIYLVTKIIEDFLRNNSCLNIPDTGWFPFLNVTELNLICELFSIFYFPQILKKYILQQLKVFGTPFVTIWADRDCSSFSVVRHLGRSGARGGHASRMSREGFAELLKILQLLSEFLLVAFLTNKIWKRKSAINKEDNQLRYVDFVSFSVKFRKGVNFLEYILDTFCLK